MKQIIPITLLILSSFFQSCEKHDRPVTNFKQLEQEVAGLIQERTRKLPFKAPVAWALVQDGEVKSSYQQGYEIPDANTPVSDQSLFLLASTTKLFTSVMVMKAVEEGKLLLSSKASEYMDDLPATWQSITISHLLSHTDGLADVMDNSSYKALDPAIAEGLNRREYLEYAAQLPQHFRPGYQTRYGQSGYVLLSLVLEKLYEQSYETIVSQKILIPMGMSHTHFFTASDVIGTYKPQVFEPDGATGFKKTTPNYVYADYATAGICTSIGDMIKFIQALQKQELLNKESFRRLYTPLEGVSGYTLGWEYRYKDGRLMAGHSGGWSVVVMHIPDTNTTNIFLSSAADESILNTGYQVAEKALAFTRQ